jgi:mannose-1-phosphate guanylyltransferase
MNFIESLQKEEVDFSTEVIPEFLGKINTFHNKFYHRDIGTPEGLKTARIDYASMFKN